MTFIRLTAQGNTRFLRPFGHPGEPYLDSSFHRRVKGQVWPLEMGSKRRPDPDLMQDLGLHLRHAPSFDGVASSCKDQLECAT